MTGSLEWIADESWPSDEGWPYPDGDAEAEALEDEADLEAESDTDLVMLHALGTHLLDGLDPLERQVIVARYGLDGAEPLSMRDLHQQLGRPRAELREALGDGLSKLRIRMG